MRLSRTFRLHEKVNLQLLAEAFNITRTNYASVNNVVGPDFGLLPGFTTFNVSGSAVLSPSRPWVSLPHSRNAKSNLDSVSTF